MTRQPTRPQSATYTGASWMAGTGATALRSPRQDDNTGRDEDEQGGVETCDKHGFQCKQRANTASVRPPGRKCVDLRETLHHDG